MGIHAGPDRAPTTRVTMKDVARVAGVSQSTVSFVLNGQQEMRISARTRKAVLEAAETLGYRPRSAGRPVSTYHTRVLGLMIDEIATSQFGAISIEAMQEESWKAGVLLEVVMTGGDKAYEAAILRKWAQDRVVGVAYASILTRRVDLPDGLARHRAVLLNCYDAKRRFASIVPAERRGGEAATSALIDAGCRRIAFITGEPWMEASVQRLEGYERALKARGIPLDPALVAEGNFLPSGGRKATLRLMHQDQKPDAIFCANDLMAVGCYEALKELGIQIGTQVAVMGYDNQEIAQHLTPGLSSVDLPHREMGQWSARKLLSDGEIEPQEVRIGCPLVPRASHGSPQSTLV